MIKYKAVIFGAIGTIVETSNIQRRSFNKAFKEFGVDWYWSSAEYKKLLEKKKYDNLMALDKDIIKIYFVSDPKGSYYFWLNKMIDLEMLTQQMPSTTFWRKHKIEKQVYMLKEQWASIINKS